MIVHENFLYAALQKTGSTQIEMILKQNFPVTTFRNHAAASPDQIEVATHRIGSIRNPWEWYLSLWRFGAAGKGNLYKKLCHPDREERGQTRHMRGMGNAPQSRDGVENEGESSRVEDWQRVYSDAESVEGFREWLRILHHPHHQSSLHLRWASLPIGAWIGFFTFRYLLVYTPKPKRWRTIRELDSPEAFSSFLAEACYITNWIRTEKLEDDLFGVLSEAGHPISSEMENQCRALPRAKETRKTKPLAAFYDDESRELVARRDAILIDQFGYQFPED